MYSGELSMYQRLSLPSGLSPSVWPKILGLETLPSRTFKALFRDCFQFPRQGDLGVPVAHTWRLWSCYCRHAGGIPIYVINPVECAYLFAIPSTSCLLCLLNRRSHYCRDSRYQFTSHHVLCVLSNIAAIIVVNLLEVIISAKLEIV